jgi:DNA-binding CsgD family transcriptional regulator
MPAPGFVPAALRFCADVDQLKSPAEVIVALASACAPQAIKVLGAWARPQRISDFDFFVLQQTVFVHPDASPDLFLEWNTRVRNVGSATGVFAHLSPEPFTFTEIMRRSDLRGTDRWLVDLFRDHGIRDAFFFPVRGWTVVFYSTRVLKVPSRAEAVLLMVASYAAIRLAQLVRINPPGMAPKLTPRELAILRHLSFGQRPRQIAKALKLSDPTIRTHIRKALKKLGARTLEQAIAEAVRWQLLA